MIAATIVDWSALGQVVLYSLAAGIGVPAVYAISVRAAARSGERGRTGLSAGGYALIAVAGMALCLGAIAFGIVLMAHK